MVGMNKYFKVDDYFVNIAVRVIIFGLKGKVDIWWEDERNVKGIGENELSWRKLKKYFC